ATIGPAWCIDHPVNTNPDRVMLRRRDLLMRAAGLAAGLLPAVPARADAWPQRPVTIVVPFAAGGSADLIGRLIAQHLQQAFGTPFVVENRSGAGGSIGAGVV